MTMQDNPFLRLLEGNEQGQRALFFGQFSPNLGFGQRDFAQSLYQPTMSRYLGELGRQVTSGQAPTLTFADFLSGQFNPQRELLRFPDDRSRLFGSRTIYDFGGR